MPIPTKELVCGMILASDENLLDNFKIVEKIGQKTVLSMVTWSASGGYMDRKNATYRYETDDDLRAQYSIIAE